MLRKPDCTFTIPSLHDGLELDGRLYFPQRPSPQGHNLNIEGIVILAHPYAPLGGSWDDAIVQTTGAVFLKAGYILNTFNFRGAAGSAGSTSWTGNAELADYVTFCALALFLINQTGFTEPAQPLKRPTLVLGGYSYGSLIASLVPNLEVLAESFKNPKVDSVEYQIAMRARELSGAFTRNMEGQDKAEPNHMSIGELQSPASPSRSLIFGGYEGHSADRRTSKDSSGKSFDAGRVRRSLDKVKQRLSPNISHSQQATVDDANDAGNFLLSIFPSIAFLLVSPLLPPISSLITLFSQPSFERQPGRGRKVGSNQQQNLSSHPVLATYGDKDKFTSAGKLRDWSHNFQKMPGSHFEYQIIEGAGHFWIEEGAMDTLCHGISQWIEKLSAHEL